MSGASKKWIDDDDVYYDVCQNCDGSGEVVICPDDICQAQGVCIHDDGMVACPWCQGPEV